MQVKPVVTLLCSWPDVANITFKLQRGKYQDPSFYFELERMGDLHSKEYYRNLSKTGFVPKKRDYKGGTELFLLQVFRDKSCK